MRLKEQNQTASDGAYYRPPPPPPLPAASSAWVRILLAATVRSTLGGPECRLPPAAGDGLH